MTETIKLKVTNTLEELKSFPLKQNIFLETSVDLDLHSLKNTIALIREPKEYGLINMGDLYNFNLGYIKETFDLVPLDITLNSLETPTTYRIAPREVLKPNSTYLLYVDKNLSDSSIEVVKSLSKGPSSLKIIKTDNKIFTRSNLNLKVMSSPSLTTTMNLIKFQLFEGEEPLRYYTINAKSKDNFIVLDGVTLEVPDTAFGLNEEFKLIVNSPTVLLEEDLILEIKTALSSSIKPIDNIKPAGVVSNEDVLKYYESLKTPTVSTAIDFTDKTWQTSEIRLEYLDSDTFMLTLDKLSAEDLDLDNIKIKEFPAFNKSDLKDLNLYNKDDSYSLTHEVLDDKNVLFTVVRL